MGADYRGRQYRRGRRHARIARAPRRCYSSRPQPHTVYTPSLRDGWIVNLGANVGEFSCAMADRGLTCHAVEAEPSVFEQIPVRAEIKKHNLAISDRNEPVHLFVSENRECNSVQP